MSSDYLFGVASKLNISDQKTIRKTKELLDLLSRRPLPCSESCKVVVCLELACTRSTNEQFSRENAIKYSGCKRSAYVNMFNIISKMVNLDKIYTVREVCLALGVSEMARIAQKVYERHKTENELTKEEEEHPMLPCASVLAVCSINKVKIDSKKLVELSRVKKSELEVLAQKLEKLAEPMNVVRSKKRLLNKDNDSSSAMVKDWKEEKECKKPSVEETENEYEEWKKRMLAE